MAQNVKSLTSQAAPWSKQVAWWVVVAEGGIALLLGLFVLLQPEQASVRFIQIVGGYVFVMSAIALYHALAHKESAPGEPGLYVRVGIGLVAGLIALIHPRLPTLDTAAATTVLAIGMLLAGAMGLYGVFATRAQGGIRWGQVIVNGLYLLFAIVVFIHNRGEGESSGTIVRWLGIIAGAGGGALIFYGLRLRRATPAEVATSSTAAAPAQAAGGAGEVPDAEEVNETQAVKVPVGATVGANGNQPQPGTNHLE